MPPPRAASAPGASLGLSLTGGGIRSTAEDAGKLDDYTNAVDEFRQAMKLNDAWQATKEAVKDQAVRVLKYAIPGAATAYAVLALTESSHVEPTAVSARK